MKLMFASDIHGSFYYGKKLTERFEAEKPEKLFLLGDILYHGARNDLPKEYSTKELTALLNSYKEYIVSVRGNCDSAIDQTVLEFPVMSDYIMVFADGHTMVLTHGDIINEDNMLPHTEGCILIHGHTHLKIAERHGNFYYINPGSVSIPKDDAFSSYMIYEDSVFTIKNTETGETLKTLKL